MAADLIIIALVTVLFVGLVCLCGQTSINIGGFGNRSVSQITVNGKSLTLSNCDGRTVATGSKVSITVDGRAITPADFHNLFPVTIRADTINCVDASSSDITIQVGTVERIGLTNGNMRISGEHGATISRLSAVNSSVRGTAIVKSTGNIVNSSIRND
jgi:hypothetical protein